MVECSTVMQSHGRVQQGQVEVSNAKYSHNRIFQSEVEPTRAMLECSRVKQTHCINYNVVQSSGDEYCQVEPWYSVVESSRANQSQKSHGRVQQIQVQGQEEPSGVKYNHGRVQYSVKYSQVEPWQKTVQSQVEPSTAMVERRQLSRSIVECSTVKQIQVELSQSAVDSSRVGQYQVEPWKSLVESRRVKQSQVLCRAKQSYSRVYQSQSTAKSSHGRVCYSEVEKTAMVQCSRLEQIQAETQAQEGNLKCRGHAVPSEAKLKKNKGK